VDILGGQAVQAERLIERLREEPSLEVSFLPINPRLPGVLRKLQAVKYVRTAVTSIFYLLTLLARVPRHDVLHVFSASYFSFVLAPTPAVLTGKLYGKKVVLNYHSGEAEDHLRRWRRTAIPVIRLADAVAVPSGYLVDVFAKFGLPARAVFNNIEVGGYRFRERNPLRPVFLANRNFEAHYNVACVLRAFALVQRRRPDARLTVAGDGSQRAALEALAAELELKNVEFLGRVEPGDMAGLYEAADIYLNGSSIDNMPVSILEAFSSGLPVVTTEAGGIPYIVEDGRNGLLVPLDDHEAMAERALRLLEDGALATALARQAREDCLQYGWARVRVGWLSLYEEVARGRARAGESRGRLNA
jgi:glycosyltransferase involved in cell wall biosynthesis